MGTQEIHHVRRDTGKTIEEIQKDFFDDRDPEEIEGWYTGKVVDNNDPDKEGKCRIRVFGVFDNNVPDEDLPWALPDFTFVGSLVGNFIVPPVGALVKVYFCQGDIYFPHYTTKAVQKNKQPTQKDTDYPDNMVMWETDDGDYLTINRKSKETTFNHNSGTQILIKKDGSVEINIDKDKNEQVNGNITINATGDIKITSTGDMKLNHTGDLKVQGLAATPVPQGGPLCALPSCLYTGAPHSGNVSKTGPIVL